MYEGFAQEESRKINENRGYLCGGNWSQQGQKNEISEQLQNDSRSLLDEVRVLPG